MEGRTYCFDGAERPVGHGGVKVGSCHDWQLDFGFVRRRSEQLEDWECRKSRDRILDFTIGLTELRDMWT